MAKDLKCNRDLLNLIMVRERNARIAVVSRNQSTIRTIGGLSSRADWPIVDGEVRDPKDVCGDGFQIFRR